MPIASVREQFCRLAILRATTLNFCSSSSGSSCSASAQQLTAAQVIEEGMLRNNSPTVGVLTLATEEANLSTSRLNRTTLAVARCVLAIGMSAVTLAVLHAADVYSTLAQDAQRLFQPLPKNMATSRFPITPERVDLGHKLYFDTRISVDGTVSCARCHQPAFYGTDGLPKARGAHNKLNPRNAPTVLNAAIQFNEHWRGDRENVEDQAKQALLGPPSFGDPDYAAAMAKIKAIPRYPEMFRKAFPGEQDPVTPDNWAKAIGAYERTLVTPSRFDQFLAGDLKALSPAEKAGLRQFIDTGCIACHNGPGVGGNTFQKFGVVEDYWKETGSKIPDKGRFDVTHKPDDMYVFKVPSLRNVAMTPPYFHDGSVRSLPRAVHIMAKVQLDKTLSDQDTNAIVTFLQSLTGKLPDNFVYAPVLPASGFEPTQAKSTKQ
jgi:cytochrome c peroxidase